MGSNTSIFENSEQETNTRVAQISNANCVNACVDSNNSEVIKITNTTINGDINFSSACLISGAGCTLKSSLDSTLLNTQANKQDADIDDENNIFTLFNQLFDIGSSEGITENNYQSISNEVTQMLNSTCQNDQEITNNSLTVILDNDNINGDINLTEKGTITNTQCILTNMGKSYVKNDQKNSQTATITKGGCLGGLGALAGVLILFIILKLFHSDHGQQKIIVKSQGTTNDDSGSDKKSSPKKDSDSDKKSSPKKESDSDKKSSPKKDSDSDSDKKSSPKKESFFGKLGEKIKNEF